MITIETIASSSKGNCYIVDNGNSRIMLECGLPWAKTREALNFQTSRIDGILVSHEHQDHSKAVKDAAKAGTDVYMSKGTANAINATGHRIHHVSAISQFVVGSWVVLPFDLVHDAAEPLGFILSSRDNDKLVFLTDTSFCAYRFRGITHLMIECNFSNNILDANIESGAVDPSRRKRLMESHMSLERVKDFITINDTSMLQEVHLMHLSDQNSDAKRFKREIQQLTGVPVYVCEA